MKGNKKGNPVNGLSGATGAYGKETENVLGRMVRGFDSAMDKNKGKKL